MEFCIHAVVQSNRETERETEEYHQTRAHHHRKLYVPKNMCIKGKIHKDIRKLQKTDAR